MGLFGNLLGSKRLPEFPNPEEREIQELLGMVVREAARNKQVEDVVVWEIVARIRDDVLVLIKRYLKLRRMKMSHAVHQGILELVWSVIVDRVDYELKAGRGVQAVRKEA